jgi:hypothetical protein
LDNRGQIELCRVFELIEPGPNGTTLRETR